MDKLHLQFCKMLLNVNKYTSAMVLGEKLGRYPITYHVDYRMLCYWYRVVSVDTSKIAKIAQVLIECSLSKNYIKKS